MSRFFIGLLIFTLVFLPCGCRQGPQRPTILGPRAHIACQRAWISGDQLAQGLDVVLAQIERDTGPLPRYQLVNDMTGHLQQCLYHIGRCSWENIDLNGHNYVIIAYFRSDIDSGTLEICAFSRGDHANQVVARCSFVPQNQQKDSPQDNVHFAHHTGRPRI